MTATMLQTEPLRPAKQRTPRSGSLVLLQTFVWAITILPARLIIGTIGSFGSPASLVGVACFGMWAVGACRQGMLVRVVWPARIALLALWIPTAISYAVMHLNSTPADEVNGADRALLFLLVWSGVALLAAEGLRDFSELLRLMRVTLAAIAFVAVAGIVQMRIGYDITKLLAKLPGLQVTGELDSVLSRSGFRRPAGTATHPIEFSCILAIALGPAISMAVYDTDWLPWRRWTTLGLIGLGIPSGISRSGIIGAAIALLFWVTGADRLHRIRTYGLSLFFATAVFLTTPGLLGTLVGWFANASEDDSVGTRTDDYPAVAKYIRRSPWVGRGPSTFLPKFRILDNQWLMSMIEVGIIGAIGLMIYLMMPFVVGRFAREATTDRMQRSLGQALAGTSFVAVASSATYDSFSYPMFPGVFAVVVGLTGALWGIGRAASLGAPTYQPLPAR